MKLIQYNQNLFSDFFDNFIYNELNKRDYLKFKTPDINVLEDEKFFLMEFAVPGKKKNDFSIEIDKNILSVGLDESKLTNSNPDLYSRREFGYESFNRTFNLPEIVDTNKIDANYEDGILKIKLNKKKTDLVRSKKVIKVM
ncbi:MAG: Hsp20/alpha crystallin family protein [Flavobacteriaceae bacterium]